MTPAQMMILAYILERQKAAEAARAAQAGKPGLGDLASLAKDTGALKGAKDFLGLGGGAAATSGGSAAVPVGTALNGGTLMSDGSIFAGSMGPVPATDITNFAGSATPYLGAAGTALGAYNAYKGIDDKNPVRAGLGGAGAALGLNAMGYALSPWGWGAMVAAPAVTALVNKMGDKDRWKTEQKRLNKLREQGINIPRMEADTLTGGRSKGELIALEEEKARRGQYSNVDFARTRDEKYLKPDDIMGYATFAEKYGNDWFGKFDEKKRREIAQQALDSGAVREHHGTIDVDWNRVGQASSPTSQPVTPGTAMDLRPNAEGLPVNPNAQKIPVARGGAASMPMSWNNYRKNESARIPRRA